MHDFKATEERILKFWEDQDIFRKSTEARKRGKPFVFFEGPPTANAAPAIHHFIGRAFKDVIPRYQTMRGRYVSRKGGWDTHGLPVELQVEKALGFKSKKDIEAYGVAAFNRMCRESVWKNKEEWERFTRRIGYWVDLKDPYITYENPYIESLWNIIRKFWDKKLLYQAHRVVPFCTRCGTPLSSHEVAQGYKTVTDTSVYVKFRVKRSKVKVPKNTYILAWTTTPWTLPGNVALAVGRDIRYVLARKGEEHFIVADDLASKVLGAPLAIERTFTGKELARLSYEPLFSVATLRGPRSYKVYEADFVTTTDGTGVVHTAVMYGEDDYKLGDKLKLPKRHTVTEQGHFTGVSEELDGMYVKSKKTEDAILAHLTAHGAVLMTSAYEHEYPFCWRCDTPLLYYAKDSWFVRMSALNKQLLANNETVNWVPEHLKHGRFGQWLREGKDWAFSRERYWGTPLPVWRSSDKKHTLVVSSLEDLDTHRGDKPATFWVMRHGEAQSNVQRLIDDTSEHPNAALTPQGIQQAQRAGRALKKKRIKLAAIIASPLLRTRQTAELAAKELGIKKIIFDERLREIQLGPSLSGCHDREYHTRYPSYESKFLERPPGGESLADLRERMWGVLRDLNEKYAGKNVLLVFHDYPIWMFADAAAGWSMERSIAEMERRKGTFMQFAAPVPMVMRNLPRDEHGQVDLHRPYVDAIVLKRGRTPLRRVPELCDVWFDSGSMPFAQWHWPFENKEKFDTQFPADFIAEAIDQTRGWFYTLLAVSTALGRGAPYRNVLSYSHVVDEKGQKMSKSKGNIVAPGDVIDAVGVDATRWYFYTLNNPGDTKMFAMREVRERLTGFMGTLANCLQFYELYRTERDSNRPELASTLLDEWMLSRLSGLTEQVTSELDGYDLTGAARAIEAFVVDDLSQWWLRRSRKRPGSIGVLRNALRQIALLAAPFVPFAAEDIWQKARGTGDAPSVHLADWPKADKAMVKPDLEEQMARVREFITAGLALRKQEGIKVRQPLRAVTLSGQRLADDLEDLVREELNVKEILYAEREPVSLDMVIGPELRAEGWAREAMRAIQEMRKEAKCTVGDKIHCQWNTGDTDIAAAVQAHADMIMLQTGLSAFVRRAADHAVDLEREFELEPGRTLWLGIKK